MSFETVHIDAPHQPAIVQGHSMSQIDRDIAAYEQVRSDLEKDHNGKWAVFYEGEQVGLFESFDAAAVEAVARFGRGPYLIRQIGASPMTMPASVMFRPIHA
jgi:hypothetical protein